MKKILMLAMALMFVSQLALAADVTVTRSMPDRVDPMGALTATFTISPSTTLTNFDLAEMIPQTWAIKDWSVSGFDRNKIIVEVKNTQDFLGKTYKGYHWKFNESFSSAVTLSYNLDVPVSSGSYGFVAIWVYPGGFDKSEKTLTVGVAPTTTTTITTTTVQPTTTTTTISLPFTIPTELSLPELIAIFLFSVGLIIVLYFIVKNKIVEIKVKRG